MFDCATIPTTFARASRAGSAGSGGWNLQTGTSPLGATLKVTEPSR